MLRIRNEAELRILTRSPIRVIFNGIPIGMTF